VQVEALFEPIAAEYLHETHKVQLLEPLLVEYEQPKQFMQSKTEMEPTVTE